MKKIRTNLSKSNKKCKGGQPERAQNQGGLPGSIGPFHLCTTLFSCTFLDCLRSPLVLYSHSSVRAVMEFQEVTPVSVRVLRGVGRGLDGLVFMEGCSAIGRLKPGDGHIVLQPLEP